MDFPILDLMDPDACYQFLVATLHPDGLRCPGCRRADALSIHDRHRPPVLDYRCRHCGAVFNAYTGTPLQKTHRSPAQLVLILRGIWQGTPTARLARELGCDRKHLLALRHKLQGPAAVAASGAGPVPGPGRRGRRDVPERGGKKASRTPTLTTRPGGGPTSGAGTGPSPTTGRRWPAW